MQTCSTRRASRKHVWTQTGNRPSKATKGIKFLATNSTKSTKKNWMEISVTCRSREETAVVAGVLAPLLRAGDAILLKGALASGKTAFVQELVAALGSQAEVTSPTFTLAQFYPLPAGTFLHIDAYRLSSIAEFRDLGLEDYVPESCLLYTSPSPRDS